MTDAQRFLANPDLLIDDLHGTVIAHDARSEVHFPDGSICHDTDYDFWALGPIKTTA